MGPDSMTAVVTGVSSGIGRAPCFRVIVRGEKIVDAWIRSASSWV